MQRLIFAFLFIWAVSTRAVSGQATYKQKDPAKDFKTGEELYRQGKFRLAYPYFEAFLKSQKVQNEGKSAMQTGDAAFYLAVCAKESGQEMAEDQLLDYLEQYPGHSKIYAAYYHLGDFYFDRSNHQDAIKYFEKTQLSALTAEEQEDYHFKYAFSYFSLKKFKEAKSRFQVQSQDQFSKYYNDASYYSGLSSYYLKEYEDAIKMFKRVEEVGKYKNTVPYYITSVLFITQKYDEVITYAEPKLSNRNLRNYTELQHLAGNAAFELKDYNKAATNLSEYVAKAGKVSQEDFYQLGYVYYQTGQYAKAIEYLNKLSALDNAMVQNAMFTLGKSYNAIGDKANAKNAFLQSSRMKYDPAIAEESGFNAAKITYELGNYNEALTALRKFIGDYPSSKYKDDAQEIMADVFLKTRNYEDAINSIEKMSSKTPNIKAAYQKMAFYRATELYNNKMLDNANLYLDKSLIYTPDKSIEALAFYWKADIAHQKGDYAGSNQWITKFLSQAVSVSSEHSSKVSAGTAYYIQGYNNFKQKEYLPAQITFEKAVERLKDEKDPSIKQTVYPDALARLADCFYIRKDFKEAKIIYNRIVQENLKGADYATYQKAILDGLSGNYAGKIEGLKSVQKSFPSSPFADDALYELGATYAQSNKQEEAITAYSTLIQSYSKSEWVPSSYNRMGLIQYNQGRMNEALISYKTVLQKYPKSEESQEALVAIKDIYINKGEPQEYFYLLKQYPGAMISTSAQDSIVYQAAEVQFSKGEYDKALKGFDSYIKQYPQGAFTLPAYFYRGECYNLSNNDNAAVIDYENVISQPVNKFTERALLRASSIRYKSGQYEKALSHYKSLLESARSEENQKEALAGILRCQYKTKQYNATLETIDKVLTFKGISETVIIEAGFYKGASLFGLQQYDKAYTELENTTKKINNEWAAEAKYLMAKIRYEQKNYAEAENQCYDFIDLYPSYESWLIKTYILLSDNYLANNQLFQAKTTLQSVLDNYEKRDELYKEAQDKYNKILELETKESKVKAPVQGAGFSEFEK